MDRNDTVYLEFRTYPDNEVACNSKPKSYGDSDCNLYWDREYALTLLWDFEDSLPEGWYFSFYMCYYFSHTFCMQLWEKFECPLCGGHCVTKIPFLETPIDVKMPNCGVTPKSPFDFWIPFRMPKNPIGESKIRFHIFFNVYMPNGTLYNEALWQFDFCTTHETSC